MSAGSGPTSPQRAARQRHYLQRAHNLPEVRRDRSSHPHASVLFTPCLRGLMPHLPAAAHRQAGPAMTRSIGEIVGELKALHSLQADAQTQLLSARRDQAKLVAHEASLLLAIEGRGRKIDKVLDEYATAMSERGKALT